MGLRYAVLICREEMALASKLFDKAEQTGPDRHGVSIFVWV
jgi:hypothetical protein